MVYKQLIKDVIKKSLNITNVYFVFKNIDIEQYGVFFNGVNQRDLYIMKQGKYPIMKFDIQTKSGYVHYAKNNPKQRKAESKIYQVLVELLDIKEHSYIKLVDKDYVLKEYTIFKLMSTLHTKQPVELNMYTPNKYSLYIDMSINNKQQKYVTKVKIIKHIKDDKSILWEYESGHLIYYQPKDQFEKDLIRKMQLFLNLKN